jgi:hypothetical protein
MAIHIVRSVVQIRRSISAASTESGRSHVFATTSSESSLPPPRRSSLIGACSINPPDSWRHRADLAGETPPPSASQNDWATPSALTSDLIYQGTNGIQVVDSSQGLPMPAGAVMAEMVAELLGN